MRRLLAAIAGVGLLAVPAVASAEVTGVDVSRFDGAIAWRKAAAAGVEFAFVQASRGSGSDCTVKPWSCGRDRRYDFNYREARRQGVRVGAYHRAFTGGETLRAAKRDARREAALFVAEVGRLRRGDLLPVLDFETPFAGLDGRRLRGWIATWTRRVEDALGARPIIYTNVSSWSSTGNTRIFARAGHRLWVANWGVSRPLVPARNWSGRGWSVWQYTNGGRVPGIPGRTDMNRLGVPLREISVRSARR